MAHSEICPVCKGKGKLDDKSCHGCSGVGWITVQDDKPIWYYPVYPTYPEPYPVYPPYQPWVTSYHPICGGTMK